MSTRAKLRLDTALTSHPEKHINNNALPATRRNLWGLKGRRVPGGLARPTLPPGARNAPKRPLTREQ